MTTIQRGDIESAVLSSGTLRPKNLVAIGAQVTGRVLSLKVEPGQQVKAGDVVAAIDSTNQKNELAKAQATLRQNEATRAQATADLELAKLDLARYQMMIKNNSAPRAEYDSAVANLKSRQAQVASSEASVAVSEIDVQIAETNLGFTRITAPLDGTILTTLVQEGQTVNAQQSVPTIAILGQLDTMIVEAEISEADIVQAREGLPLYFTISGRSTRRYQATLERIEPAPDSIAKDRNFMTDAAKSSSASDSSAIYYKGLFSIPNPDGLLKTYMTAEIHIVLAKAQGALVAPNSALRATGEPNRATVRVASGIDTIEERTVETGITDRINTQILSGLKEGDRIVTEFAAPPASTAGL